MSVGIRPGLRDNRIRVVRRPLMAEIGVRWLHGPTIFALVAQLVVGSPLKMDTVSVRVRSWAMAR